MEKITDEKLKLDEKSTTEFFSVVQKEGNRNVCAK